MAKMRQILIIGNNDNGCTPELEKTAYDAGKHVAESNSVLITGGLGGVMKAASHGCLLYTSPSPRDRTRSRMPSSA